MFVARFLIRGCGGIGYLKNAHSSTGKKKRKCALQQQYARTWCVRACVCLWVNLLLTPAPVSGGSVCGGGGVCLWLAVLFRFVGALGIVCVCVFVNVSEHLFTG